MLNRSKGKDPPARIRKNLGILMGGGPRGVNSPLTL